MKNLYYELPITFSDATLGTSVEVPSIDGGKFKIKIPAGTQYGKQFRLKGKVCHFKKKYFRDLYISECDTGTSFTLKKTKRNIRRIQ